MCICSRLNYCLGNLTYIFERLASCCALTAVVTCMMTTLLVMLAVGTGLGYNYCFVDIQTGRNKDDPYPIKFSPVHGHVTRNLRASTIKSYRKAGETSPVTPEVLDEVEPTMIIDLSNPINYNSLVDKIRRKKINATLELFF